MRHVIVTGGSRGLGLTLVEGLLGEGYRVSTCSRACSDELATLAAAPAYADRLRWHPCNLGVASEVEAFVDAAVAWAGPDRLYGLVNNAGIAPEGVLATFPTVAMDQVVQVNLIGAMQMARAALRVLLRAPDGGRIINISSIIGLRGYTGLAAYSATKAGLDGLTRALAREVGRRGITVNSVAPGYLSTEMSSSLTQRQQEQIVNRTPLGRLGMPADVFPVVRFLLGDEAGFVTGQTIVVDGGISC
jgi:3-oxoacyl-[acyl-carrier protein] reductase